MGREFRVRHTRVKVRDRNVFKAQLLKHPLVRRATAHDQDAHVRLDNPPVQQGPDDALVKPEVGRHGIHRCWIVFEERQLAIELKLSRTFGASPETNFWRVVFEVCKHSGMSLTRLAAFRNVTARVSEPFRRQSHVSQNHALVIF